MIAATEQPRERLCTACFTGKYPIELPSEDRRGKSIFDDSKGGPLAGTAAEVTVERPVAHKPSKAKAVSIETRPGTEALEHKFDGAPAASSGTGSCEPGPDSDLEDLVLPQDTIPADSTGTDREAR